MTPLPDGEVTVSVVIPCYNDAGFLQRVLGALANQTTRPHQIIVVDNNSTDATRAVAEAFQSAYYITEPRQGIPPAAATGYDAATGTVIVRIDADTLPAPTFIADVTRMWERIHADNVWATKRTVAATGTALFGTPTWYTRLISTAYLGAYYATTGSALGHYPLFGTNFSMLTSWWRDIRTDLDTTVEEVHDDLHLSFAIRPGETVWLQRDLTVEMDTRALRGGAQLVRRFRRGFRTMFLNFRMQPPWRRLAQRGQLPGNLGKVAAHD
ncbi:glycosyl transferase family protein [Corynebacterium renale]|uniref:Glycosyltransferase involved in cell wall biosynthesis n=1 Tax=Corynebacterium renale TaxID=1724 RepID=A0A2A9DPS0_9CORY|nr:glycosyltransferase family 2 protein [Corynebacterium renale]PFG27920.1 glycosyltransferase involved in cell wall biosynthesis [Corynebacterium renale]SQG63360.1 glycosyl transferase family protein [Corynebacterium renale]SQI21870.1 glycosyl transferase family protein [Corynebacterium renale]STC99742.1 glycosyl transferase family protein [Corynebacterium renale]